MPFWGRIDNYKISNTFGDKKQCGSGNETSTGGVGFDKNEITDDGNKDIEKGIDGGSDLDFAGAFACGKNN